MKFRIIWDEKASNELNKLETIIARRITKKIKDLSQNPFSLDIKKIRGEDTYRLRIGKYRVLLEIEGNNIYILKVSHRRNIYKKLSQ